MYAPGEVPQSAVTTETSTHTYKDKFWYPAELQEATKYLTEGQNFLICGANGSGKTTLAYAATTLFLQQQAEITGLTQKSHFIGMQSHNDPARLERSISLEKERLTKIKPAVVIIDEVAPGNLAIADKLVELIKEFGAKIILIAQTRNEPEVNGEKVKSNLLAIAEQDNYANIGNVVSPMPVITLPDPQWERVETAPGVIREISARFGESSGNMITQVQDPALLLQMLE